MLKPTGSLYLHCDPPASHYLKIVLDGVFGKENFRNEAIWKRTTAHSSAKKFAPVHDTILSFGQARGEDPPGKKKPFWQMVALGATHCGSGCTLADIMVGDRASVTRVPRRGR